jgi:F-box protein 21
MTLSSVTSFCVMEFSRLTVYRVHDKSVRYVAAENVEPVGRDTLPSPAIMRLAGKHFKRWDGASHSFVSNLKDEYPDD